jgi:hypothetical protein
VTDEDLSGLFLRLKHLEENTKRTEQMLSVIAILLTVLLVRLW